MLADFVNHASARAAGLSEAHVLALRLYTSACFCSLNAPMRHLTRDAENKVALPPRLLHPHPMPTTITFIFEGIVPC